MEVKIFPQFCILSKYNEGVDTTQQCISIPGPWMVVAIWGLFSYSDCSILGRKCQLSGKPSSFRIELMPIEAK
jgi:hypothetical protein